MKVLYVCLLACLFVCLFVVEHYLTFVADAVGCYVRCIVTGAIPTSLGMVVTLQYIDLDTNSLTGRNMWLRMMLRLMLVVYVLLDICC